MESLQREEAATDERDILQEQMKRHQDQISRLQDEIQMYKASASTATDSKRYHELDNKYRQAKLERTELLRTQSLNSQKLLELSDSIKHSETLKEHLEDEINKLQAEVSSGKERLDYFERLVSEKDLNIQILEDELQALQLELLGIDDRAKALERENRQLVDRWLSKVNETVDKLNAEVQRSSASLESLDSAPQSDNIVKKRLDIGQSIESLVSAPHHSLILPVVCGSMAIFDRLESTKYLVSADASYKEQVFRPQFSLSADMVAAFCPKDPDNAVLWSVESCRIVGTLTGALGSPFTQITTLSTSNNAMMAAHRPSTLRLYDVPRQFCLWSETLDSPIESISSLRIHNSDLTAVLLSDGRILLCDVRQRSIARKSSHSLPKLSLVASDPFHQLLLATTDRAIISLDAGSMRMAQSIPISPIISASREVLSTWCISVAPSGDGQFVFSNGTKVYRGNILDGALNSVNLPHASTITGASWTTIDHLPYLVTAEINGAIMMS